MNEQAEQALALAGFPGPLVDAVGNALAYIDHLRGIRDEQAAKLRRHLDEIAELRERAGIAEGREAAAKANAEEMAGWLDARNAGLVQMARERDALREKLAAAEQDRDEVVTLLGEIRELARTRSCGPAVHDDLWAVKELADTFILRNAAPPGAVIVETASGE